MKVFIHIMLQYLKDNSDNNRNNTIYNEDNQNDCFLRYYIVRPD